MVFEIKRFNETKMVCVAFAGDVPVEVREALMSAGFSWLWYKKAWTAIQREDLTDEAIARMISEAAEGAAVRPVATKAEEKALHDEYMELIMQGESEKWRKFYEARIGTLVKLTDGRIVNIEKPRIQTDFCYGESGYDAAEAADRAYRARSSEDHFRRANLRELKSGIDFLSRNPELNCGYMENQHVVVSQAYYDRPRIAAIHYCSLFDRDGKKVLDEVSEEDRERLLEGYRKAYAAFEKRINAYLKRYGLSKVTSWTYWRDA